MSCTMFKKGLAWLERDFLQELEDHLNDNFVVDVAKLIKFSGRDKIIANMLSRGELEKVTTADTRVQEKINYIRKEEGKKKANDKKRLQQEEEELMGRMLS